MPKALINNNAATTISVAVSTVGQTAITVTSAATFPVPTGGDYFYMTLLDAANVPEVVQVTGVAGNVFTVVRGRDGTAARTFLSGASARLCLCAAVFTELARLDGPTFTDVPRAPTATVGTNTTQLATTAYTVAEIISRAVLSTGGTYTGTYNWTGATVTVATRPPGTSDNSAASTGFVAAASLAAAGIPTQTGNAGKALITNGSSASWGNIGLVVETVTGTSQTAVAGTLYVFTNVAACTLTLPAASGSNGIVGAFFTNGLSTNVIARASGNICGLPENLTLDNPSRFARFYRDVINSWEYAA